MNFKYIKSSDGHNSPMLWLILSSFYRQRDQGIKQLNSLPNITWPVSGRATFDPWQAGSNIHALTYYAMLPCLSIFMELSDWKVPV